VRRTSSFALFEQTSSHSHPLPAVVNDFDVILLSLYTHVSILASLAYCLKA